MPNQYTGPGPVAERFWAKVDKTEGCWIWTAARSKGYGRITIAGRGMYAHRYAYEQLVGPIPGRLELDHRCRVPACVNPAHLEPVTHRENVLRGESPAALHAAKTHCPRGHELTIENCLRRRVPHGHGRDCKTCHRERERARWRARRHEGGA